jgi:hypothetical protein
MKEADLPARPEGEPDRKRGVHDLIEDLDSLALPRERISRRYAAQAAILAWIRELTCIACGIEGHSEAAHTGTDGGMSIKASDYSCVPLCSDCHTQAPGAYHRVGKRAFEQRHGLSFGRIVARLNIEWLARCA